jgi:hypothetical protein
MCLHVLKPQVHNKLIRVSKTTDLELLLAWVIFSHKSDFILEVSYLVKAEKINKHMMHWWLLEDQLDLP